MFGHRKIEATLARSITMNRVFPTWVFVGRFGVGKSTMAHKFAKCLLSGYTPENESLDIDSNDKIHHLIDSRTHPDFFVTEKGIEPVSIDAIRALLGKIRMTPALSKWRVVILEGADTFNVNIYNALLKFLEEPPSNTVIILICNSVGTLPKTLLSRAAKVYFNPVSTENVEQFLRQKNVENAKELSRISGGSIGYALYLNEHNGCELYQRILQGFVSESESQCALKYIIENNYKDYFELIIHSFTRILRIYTNIAYDIANDADDKELQILRPYCLDTDVATRKSMEIIDMLNRCESQMLDKNAVVVCAYEKFFS